MSEDTIFLIFVWACLAGPLIVMGIGFLLSIRWLMGMALFVVALMSIFAQTSAAEGGDPQPPESRRARVGWGVVLVIVGVAVGVFFSAAA